MKKLLLASIVLLLAVAPSVEAEMVSIDMCLPASVAPGDVATGAAAVGSAGDQWNYYTDGSVLSCIDVAGNPTSVTFQLTAPIVAVPIAAGPEKLMWGYHFVMGPDATGAINIGGLAPDTSYELYLYSSAGLPQSMNYQGSKFTFDGGTTWDEVVSGDALTYVEGENYLVVNATSDAAGNIAGTWAPIPGANGYNAAAFNGIQIIPEPMTLSLLGIGGLALLRRKRS